MYIVNDVITSEGETKKAFYKSIGMESIDGGIVQVKVWGGEHSQSELQNMRVKAIEYATISQAEIDARIEQSALQVKEIDEKLSHF